MTAGFNPQYQQYTQYTPQLQGQACYPAASIPGANAVNIQIFNPVANAGPVTQNAMQPATAMYPVSSIYGAPNATAMASASYPMNYNAPINSYKMEAPAEPAVKEAAEAPKEDKKEAEKTEKKEKVLLTDNYIKTLENYLNNEDPKIRLTAAKELLDRFKEDDTRKSDPALCALLNKVIQDPKASVRYVGLTTLDVGYAQGNSETVEILKQLQNRSDLEYGEDARLAAEILLKMAGQKVEVPSPAQNSEVK